MSKKTANFRFYEELNDFLPFDKKKITFSHQFYGTPSVKDVIESFGIPHTEVDLILCNGTAVNFEYQLQEGDRIAVYPVFESLDITKVTRLRKKPLREAKFILDVHLGKLARLVRMLGFDCIYETDLEDKTIIKIAKKEKRIILTRDKGLLKDKTITHGHWVRETEPKKQLKEILSLYDLFKKVEPFTRCMECNGRIVETDKSSILDKLPPKTKDYFEIFYICTQCKNIYWEGSHYENMKEFIKTILE